MYIRPNLLGGVIGMKINNNESLYGNVYNIGSVKGGQDQAGVIMWVDTLEGLDVRCAYNTVTGIWAARVWVKDQGKGVNVANIKFIER